MSTITQRGPGIVGMAVLLGILGDILLRAAPWGLNVPIWLGVAAAGGWALTPDGGSADSPRNGWSVALALFFASCLAWRDSTFLAFWNTVAALAALSLVAMQARGVRLRVGHMLDYALGAAAAGCNAVFGAVALSTRDLPWGFSHHGRSARKTLVGLALSIPLLFVFGGLLMSADPGFERIVRSAIDIDFSIVASHLIIGSWIAWISAGFLGPIATGKDPVLKAATTLLQKPTRRPTLGALELGIPLGSLTLIFFAFVVIQVRYVLGGDEVILATAGLTYAEYARTGFFELVAAAALVLPVLLAGDWLVNRKTDGSVRVFRTMASGLLVLVGLIMLSALHRMSLYVEAYGLTQDRFYATAFMAWVGVVIVCFAATVLRDLRRLFAFGAVASGFTLLALLNTVNPDAIIARVNMSRVEVERDLDTQYIQRLSADAAPELLRSLDALSQDDRCVVLESTQERLSRTRDRDWRSWNVARWRARRVLAMNSAACRSS